MKARDVMSSPVVSIPDTGTVEEAVRLMLDNHVSALPVLGADGKLVGLISEGDLMRRLRDKSARRRSWWLEFFANPDGSARDFVRARSHRIAEVMTREVASVSEDTPVAEIARMLEKRRIKRVPVLRDGEPVGIVSRANLLRALAARGEAALPATSASDAELHDAVAAAIGKVPGAAPHLITFTVQDGDVSVWGVADSDDVEAAIRVAAENVPGVRSVATNMGRIPYWGYGI